MKKLYGNITLLNNDKQTPRLIQNQVNELRFTDFHILIWEPELPNIAFMTLTYEALHEFHIKVALRVCGILEGVWPINNKKKIDCATSDARVKVE